MSTAPSGRIRPPQRWAQKRDDPAVGSDPGLTWPNHRYRRGDADRATPVANAHCARQTNDNGHTPALPPGDSRSRTPGAIGILPIPGAPLVFRKPAPPRATAETNQTGAAETVAATDTPSTPKTSCTA